MLSSLSSRGFGVSALPSLALSLNSESTAVVACVKFVPVKKVVSKEVYMILKIGFGKD